MSGDSTALDVRFRTKGLAVSSHLLNAVTALAHALEAKDPYTRGHSARVSLYGLGIARAMRLNPRTITAVVLGGELHDVGKIGVPGALLRKHGPLTAEEHREVMQHTVVGEHILQPLLANRTDVLAVVRSHHERPDGTGFPDGLQGDDIPLAARVIGVADAFDAMTSARPYRVAPLSHERALAELREGAGTQFDDECVGAFMQEFGERDGGRTVPPDVRPVVRPAGGRMLRLV